MFFDKAVKKNHLSKIFILFFIFAASQAFTQEALKSLEEEYYDFLSLTGIVERPTLGYRTLSDSVWNFTDTENEQSDSHIWKNNKLGTNFTIWQNSSPAENWFTRGIKQGLFVRIYGPEWFNSYNTAVPYGQNDGALWQGRGYNTALTTGLRVEGYGFELTFKPQLSWSENREFEYIKGINNSNYNYFCPGVDLIQRYGNSSFWNYDWGDSEIRWSWHTFTMGIGTQNPWLGPAWLNSMLGSNNAAGYLKFDAGLRKTNIFIPHFNIPLGSIEARIWLGQLKESEYFDEVENNNERMLTGLSASYNPSFIPGFTIGLNRIFMTYWKNENIKYLLRLFTTEENNALAESGNDEDQKAAIFVDWKFDKIGFEFYGELGLDDYTSNRWANPFHTAIYTVGIKQSIPLPSYFKSELNLEWNNFEMSQDFQLQWPYTGFYSHGFVSQGYTHKGQILGSGSGYFGNSQYIQYKVYYPKGFSALKFHRYCPNNNYVYNQAINTASDAIEGPLYKKWYGNFETYFVFGLETNFFITKSFNMDFQFNYMNIECRNYNIQDTANNFNLQLQLKYSF